MKVMRPKIESIIGDTLNKDTFFDVIFFSNENRTIRRYSRDGRRIYTKHIIDIVDDGDTGEILVVLKEWGFYKQRWIYTVEPVWTFECDMTYGTLTIGRRCS